MFLVVTIVDLHQYWVLTPLFTLYNKKPVSFLTGLFVLLHYAYFSFFLRFFPVLFFFLEVICTLTFTTT